MVVTNPSRSAEVRAKLSHPIIDADGHLIELTPVIQEYIKQIGGSQMVERHQKAFEAGVGYPWYRMGEQERRDTLTPPPPWWGLTVNSIDRATVMIPKLLHSRMDELGIDFSVLYGSWDLGMMGQQDEELRRVGCRAVNTYLAELYGPFKDRMTPAALIPCVTPKEAIEELEYAVNVLGLKAAVIANQVRRPIPAVHAKHPEMFRYAYWTDFLGLDSLYDYDPLWAKCLELGVSPTTHSGGLGQGTRRTSNFMYNHLGHFAAGHEAASLSLLLGGVTRRFPTLKFAFLEGGVGWACRVYSDFYERWKKRNLKALSARLNPANLDQELMLRMVEQSGDAHITAKRDELKTFFAQWGNFEAIPHPRNLDDYALAKIEKAEDIRELFVDHFYFGCEADDPLNAWAFNTKINPLGAKLKAMSSSDMGHWDVPDLREVAEELHEPVEEGLISPEDFERFVFLNPAGLWASANPHFFKGTKVEADVAKALQGGRLQ